MKRVIVIGGGASGMVAAVFAAKQGARVTLLEKKEQLGKKLSVTGNGHGNLTHDAVTPEKYYGDSPAFLEHFLSSFSTEEALSLFEEFHLPVFQKEGYYYPLTNQASTAVYAFTEALKKENVEVICNASVTDVQKKGSFFSVKTSLQSYEADSVILSCGSEASVRDKLPYVAYDLLQKFHLSVKNPLPALVSLFGSNGFEEFWAGVRTKATVSFGSFQETGELQLTKNGISGIPVFNCSHPAVEELQQKKSVLLFIDFLPDYSREMLLDKFQSFREASVRLESFMRFWFPEKLGRVLVRKAELSGSVLCSVFTEKQTESFFNIIKKFPYEVTGYGSMQEAQAAQGGVSLQEINDRFEVKRMPGLYITGELLNVDGICGGYNLHFAFGSGKIAGTAAGEDR